MTLQAVAPENILPSLSMTRSERDAQISLLLDESGPLTLDEVRKAAHCDSIRCGASLDRLIAKGEVEAVDRPAGSNGRTLKRYQAARTAAKVLA